jgi:predicted cation transporter
MAVDISKLSRGEQVIGVSGIVLFIFSFFKWYELDFGGGSSGGLDIPGISVSASGWDTTLGLLAAIIAIVMVAQVVASKLGGMNMPDLGSVTWGQVHLGLGALALLFLIIRLIDAGDGLDRKIGLFVSFVAAAGLAVGGYLKFQEEKAGGGAVPRPPAA